MWLPPELRVDPGVARPGIAPNTVLTELDSPEATQFARDLTNAKVPIFVARRSADPKAEFVRPIGWQDLTAVGNSERLARWRPGMAVCAVTGGLLVVVDVDPRHGGDVDATRDKLVGLGVRIFAEVRTPGDGGGHLCVAGRPDIASGMNLPGWPGVDIQSDGRNVFLPGTSRPKYDGRGYHIVRNDLAALADGGDPFGADALAGALAEAKATVGMVAESAGEVAPPWDGTPISDRVRVYLESSVRQSADRVAQAATGGRNHVLNAETFALARLAASTGYPTDRIAEAMVTACTTNGLIADDGRRSVDATIRSAIRSGMLKPRMVVLADRPGLQGKIDAATAEVRANGDHVNGTVGGTATTTPASDPTGQAVSPALAVTLDVITADMVPRRRVAYLMAQRIPLGAVTVMPGEEGIGKTTVGARIIADITRGTLAGEYFGSPKDVVVLAAEDGIEDVFVPRLAEAGADLARVHIVRGRIGPDDGGEDVILPRDLALVGDLVTETGAALVWVDSLVTTLPDDMKSIAYKDTAKVLRAIGGWAESHRLAVVAPWHLNKATGSDAAVRMMDSRAFRTAVRSVLLVVADPDAEEGVTQGIVALDKANAGTLAVPALRYRIRSAPYVVTEIDPVTNHTREVATSCGVAEWIGEVEGDGRAIARSALTPAIDRAGGPREWLRGYLDGREVERKDVVAAGEKAGYSRASITRAASAIPVHSREVKGQESVTKRPFRRALWSLPKPGPQWAHQSSHPSIAESTEPTGEGSNESIEPISAGRLQSAQLAQSSMGGQLELIGESTGDLVTCRVCGQPLLLNDGRAVCARTDDAHRAARDAADGDPEPLA